MFGCIVAGRLVQTNLQQVDQFKYVLALQDAQSINHIVIFMTGQQAFPAGYAATVHLFWPSETHPHWQLLGMISNEKPSAIFKLGGQKTTSSFSSANGVPTAVDAPGDVMMDASGPHTQMQSMDTIAAPSSITAQLGISIEPIAQVQAQIQTLQLGSHSVSMTGVTTNAGSVEVAGIAAKLLDHFYNYCSSFTTNLPSGASVVFSGGWSSSYIPFKTVQDWYNNVQNKLKSDATAGFLNN
ncbi:uncharacterized protein BJ171DRAFT_194391 [Polychytrium aggregatum]|uniref:uncharacterized protein n=1 Tax=Polychytrium aggregatum TaxID=110093 RepID=UPI0022FF1FFA|nr:uncharacterized protein BJ171DRAFT_194391 [Polychytrium aggregatum]KAI9202018.1 hypothetical protein BJ171DRAFT_194391 [Polychytrium aggregatum]